MRVEYPLELIDPKTFEQMGVALARAVIGNGVEIFGDGPDGGREAIFEGRVEWSRTPGYGDDVWNGYLVIQAKHRAAVDPEPTRNLAWLKNQIGKELKNWMKADPKERRIPQYLLFITNARLSPAAGGGIESLHQYIDDQSQGLRARGLKGWKVWHRDQVVSLLTNHDAVRRAFPSFLSAASESILSRLESLERATMQPTRNLLYAHAKQGLRYEQWVNFGEAGADSKKSLCQVVVDLPVRGKSGLRGQVLGTLVDRSERVLRASLNPADVKRHAVITGAPGNGKSTISRYLVQFYRFAFMAREELPASLVNLQACNARSVERLGLKNPRQQRWPVRIDLAEWASSDLHTRPFMFWLSHKVGERAGQAVSASQMRAWLREWPWLVVFDGLDEVTNLAARRAILGHIKDFIDEIDDDDADVFLVVTTRPGGYTDELPDEHFEQLELDYFSAEEAVHYGDLITRARLDDDKDRSDAVLERFAEASKDPATLRLLKTPLQVLIITVILELHRSLPIDRYGLFWTYFETLFARERSKANELATFLTRFQQDVTHLHEVVGIRLQIRSEQASNSRAHLDLSELQSIADQRFLDVGYTDGDERRLLVRQMIEAATKRLILLVPGETGDRDQETVTFELRSLQELMAARWVSSGSPDSIRERLMTLAPSPHWRNTWVFVAGRLFSQDDSALWTVVTDVLAALDKDDRWPGWLSPIAPGLAAELLDDGLASTKPRWQALLLDAALAGLVQPLPIDLAVVARGLSVAWLGTVQRKVVQNALATSFSGSEAARYAASRVLAESTALRRLFSGVKTLNPLEVKTAAKGRNRRKLGSILRPELVNFFDSQLPPEFDLALLELDAVQTVEQQKDMILVGTRPKDPPDWSAVIALLTNTETNWILKEAFATLPPEHWALRYLAAREIYPTMARRPAGQSLI